MRWRGAWAGAQVTGVIVSTLIWIVVAGLSPGPFAATAGVGVLLVVGRNTRAGLWWRFGARPATPFEERRVLAAIVPIGSLRGRRQPTIWVASRLPCRDAVMPSPTDLLVSPALLRQIVTGGVTDNHLCVLVSQAAGREPADQSLLAATVGAYCIPWAVIEMVVSSVGHVARRAPMLSLSWKARWLILAVALVDSARSGRWLALLGLAAAGVLSATTPYLRKRWEATLRRLGDERVVADGFGHALATMLRRRQRSIADEARAEALEQASGSASHAAAGYSMGGRDDAH